MLSSAICDVFTFSFGLWTLLCHLMVFTDGTLKDLILSFVSISFLLFLWVRIRRRRSQTETSAGTAVAEPVFPGAQTFQHILLWTMVFLAVLTVLVVHRPDADDSCYVNRAVIVADDPTNPTLSYYGRHSLRHVRIKDTSKLISNEMLVGAVSFLTGIPAIWVFHFLFPVVAAVLMILAYSELFRLIAPKYWAYGVLAVTVFLCANGEVHRTYGNFSLVRLHQGKGVLVSVVVPLMLVYAFRFARQPNGRNWLLLSCSQIAAVGMSSTGLMVAPSVAGLALLTGVTDMDAKTAFKRFALGITASAYLLGLGVFIKAPLIRYYVNPPVRYENSSVRHLKIQRLPPSASASKKVRKIPRDSLFKENVRLVFGNGRFIWINLIILLTAWFWSETALARRLCLIFPMMVFLLFANPFTAEMVARYVTTGKVYWRVFWILPLPAIAGTALLAPLSSRKLSIRFPRLRYGFYGLILLLLVGVASERTVFSKENGVTIGIPHLKVPPEYRIARYLNDAFDDRPNVLAPVAISAWLPTMHHHPYPLVSRFNYVEGLLWEAPERVALTYYIMGSKRPNNGPRFLSEALQRYQVAAVCLPRTNAWSVEIRGVLRASNFEQREVLLSYEIWILGSRGSE